MNIQNNIPQFYEMSIPTEELEKTRLLLSKLGFELYEIWSHESGESYENWKSEKVTVKVNIIQQENANDASRSDIVNELDYIFWELRAIKNTIVDAVYEDNIDIESAEKILGVKYSKSERAQMLNNLEGQILSAKSRRQNNLDNSVQMASKFDQFLKASWNATFSAQEAPRRASSAARRTT